MAQTDIAKTGLSRVFMTTSASSPAVNPVYQTCLVVGGVSQNFGDREPIYCQDPYALGKFKTVGMTESPAENVESSLNGRFPSNTRSNLINVARAGAPVDIHIHVGAVGSNPSIFNQYRMAIIFEGARFSSLEIDELGAHDEDTPVGHQVDFSADNWYQIVPLVFSERGAAVTDLEIQSVGLFYNSDLTKPPKERVLALATGKAAVAVKSDFYYSIDQGTNWYAVEIATLDVNENADSVAVIGEYAVVASSAVNGLHYVTTASLDGVTVASFTEVTTGFVASKFPRAICSIGSVGFIAGAGGYVYKTTNPAGGVTVMSAGTASTQALNAIAALDETTIVAVGAANAVLVCRDGENFSAVTGPAVGVSLESVAVLGETTYLVGTADGKLWYTTNAGISWTEKSFPGSGSGAVSALSFASRLVGYMGQTLSGSAVLLRTVDAGYSWAAVPTTGVATYLDSITGVATISNDVNLVILGGLDDGATKGSVVIGEPID